MTFQVVLFILVPLPQPFPTRHTPPSHTAFPTELRSVMKVLATYAFRNTSKNPSKNCSKIHKNEE